jgi:hypothetical protein
MKINYTPRTTGSTEDRAIAIIEKFQAEPKTYAFGDSGDAETYAAEMADILSELVKEQQEFIEECSKYIPESYDDDAAVESIVIRFLKDMEHMAGIIARLTSSYR